MFAGFGEIIDQYLASHMMGKKIVCNFTEEPGNFHPRFSSDIKTDEHMHIYQEGMKRFIRIL